MNKTEKGGHANLINRVLETQIFKEYERRKLEETRIGIAWQVAIGKITEDSEYKGFNASTGKGEDEKDRERQEEYCYVCEKFIGDGDVCIN